MNLSAPHPHGRRTAGGFASALRAALLLVMVVLMAAPAAGEDSGAPDPQLQQKRQQVRQLAQERSQIEEKLAYFKASRQELESEIARLSELVRASRERKRDLERQVAGLTRRQGTLEEALKRQQDEIGESRARIALRLRRLYRFSKLNGSSTLFQAARFRTFARNTRYLAEIQDADRKAIAEFEALVDDTRRNRAELEHSLEQIDAVREELAEEQRLLDERERFLQSSLADLDKNRKLYARYLSELEQMMTGMEQAIHKLERQSARQASAPAPRPAVPATGLRGKMPPPAQGQIVAAFGEQDPRYDLKKFQRGIVIRVPDEAPVRAVADGRVLHAGPFRGYGELVVLDHGEGVFTVYGYLKRLAVKRGQVVAAGAQLGQATFQPTDNAYNVYFEIRRDGTPEDPMLWLRPDGLASRN